MTVLVLTGSARKDSHTRRLGEQLVAALPGAVLAPRLTELPFFDQDLEATPPPVVSALRAQVAEAEAIVVVTPEYNGTIPGLLGNAIDWLSRPADGSPAALRGKPAIAVAASPGGVGGVRALVALRTVLGNAGADLLDATLSVPEVHARLEDAALAAELAALGAALELAPAAAA
ncbi:MAG: NAD(P)H-dependent oxidoreductase [Mycobacteriales bacterium]